MSTCKTCTYWKHNPDAPVIVQKAGPIKLHGKPGDGTHVPEIKTETGLCYLNPPIVMIVPGTIQGTVAMQRVFPNMLEGEYCAQHPDRVLNREYTLERARFRARADTVAYNPQEYGDAAAGFNAAPSLEAAKKMATVAEQCAAIRASDSEDLVYLCGLPRGHKGEHQALNQWSGVIRWN